MIDKDRIDFESVQWRRKMKMKPVFGYFDPHLSSDCQDSWSHHDLGEEWILRSQAILQSRYEDSHFISVFSLLSFEDSDEWLDDELEQCWWRSWFFRLANIWFFFASSSAFHSFLVDVYSPRYGRWKSSLFLFDVRSKFHAPDQDQPNTVAPLTLS